MQRNSKRVHNREFYILVIMYNSQKMYNHCSNLKTAAKLQKIINITN